MNLEDKLIALQEKQAFQEATIEALDKALQSQQLQMMHLENLVKRMRDEMIAMQNSPDFMPADQEPPPPHY